MALAELVRNDGLVTDQDETRQTMDSAPPPAPSAARRLTRRTSNKVLGGVASGIADYFGIDPVLARIAFIVLFVVGGSGALLYLIGWVVMPPDDGTPSAGERLVGRSGSWRLWIGAGLIIFAALHFVGHVFVGDTDLFEPDFLWGVGLVALGVYLLMRDEPDDRPTPARATETAPSAAAGLTPPAHASGSTTATAPIPAVARAPRARSPLGVLTVGAGLLALGAAALLDNLGVVEMTFSRYPALLLAVIGVGLVAGTWWGRSRGLIVLGVLLTPVVVTAGLVNVPLEGGIGERHFFPQDSSEVLDEYRLAMGELVVDMSALELTTETIEIDASVGMGELRILLPRDTNVVVRGDVGAGEVAALGSSEGGLGVKADRSSNREPSGLLVVNGSVGIGRVEFARADEG